MDNLKFREAYEKFLGHRPFDNPDKYNAALKAMETAAAPEHDFKNVGTGMSDQGLCACGWTSRGYWDGAEYAYDEWLKHVADVVGLIEKECPCGKRYKPADGGKACHALVEVP